MVDVGRRVRFGVRNGYQFGTEPVLGGGGGGGTGGGTGGEWWGGRSGDGGGGGGGGRAPRVIAAWVSWAWPAFPAENGARPIWQKKRSYGFT